MTFSTSIDQVFKILEEYAVESNPSGILFTTVGWVLSSMFLLSAVLTWAGLILHHDDIAWAGVALMTVATIITTIRVYRDVRNPSVSFAGLTRTGAKRQVIALEKLHALPLLVLEDSEAYLGKQISTVEEAMMFLLGPLRTLGLAGGITALLALGTALESWIPTLKDSSFFVVMYSAFTFGLLIGAERSEAGLVQLRLNRDLLTRTIKIQKSGQPLP